MMRSLPTYRYHKPSGQAVVTLNGKDFYLGWHGSTESRAEYDRLIAEWLANGRRLPGDVEIQVTRTVNDILLVFMEHAQRHYVRVDGTPTSELGNFRLSLRPVRQLYGHTCAAKFGPLALKAIQQKMIDQRLARGVINQRIGRIKRMFRWATENELVPPGIYQALQTVRGLERGRSGARETEPVRPVPLTSVKATMPFLTSQVAAMVRLQLLTGMRPGEVVPMRGIDLDRSGVLWLYQLTQHKNSWRGHARTPVLGPQAQEILGPFLKADENMYLFSPREAMEETWRQRRERRKTKVQPSQSNRRKLKPKRKPKECYTTSSYGRAVRRACEQADVPHWHPNQLRHTRATEIRALYGLDAARAVLGHRSPQITEVYAEIDSTKAAEVMRKIG